MLNSEYDANPPMHVSYQHANPHHGRESYLIRFEGVVPDQTSCLLVDSGQNVDLDVLLGDDEHLSGVLLTHAHLDHYLTLEDNLRDGAPVYATPETARAVTANIEDAGDHYFEGDTDTLRERLTPVTDWERVVGDVRIHPVPAGHSPGACGFLIQFSDDTECYNLLATGDFTMRRAGGYSGFEVDLPVDVLFLCGATNDSFPDDVTKIVGRAIEGAHAGSTTLLTASGLTGVHLAHLFAQLNATEQTTPIPITLAGRVATLWNVFGYDGAGVEAVEDFTDPSEVLSHGGITIAGPEVPTQGGSSERLFDAIKDDGSALTLQVKSGGFETVSSATCRLDEYHVSNHPTQETVDDVVEEVAPVHTVVMHQDGGDEDRYKDRYDCMVWATNTGDHFTLYEGGEWQSPEWVGKLTERRIFQRQYTGNPPLGSGAASPDVDVPPVERAASPDFAAEGLDVDRLHDEFRFGHEVGETEPKNPSDDDTTAAADDSTDSTATKEATPDGGAGEEAGGSEVDMLATTANSAAEAGDGQGVPSSELLDRLDRLEDAVTGEKTTATVVDAGAGVTLLRVDDDNALADLEHGDEITLRLGGLD